MLDGFPGPDTWKPANCTEEHAGAQPIPLNASNVATASVPGMLEEVMGLLLLCSQHILFAADTTHCNLLSPKKRLNTSSTPTRKVVRCLMRELRRL